MKDLESTRDFYGRILGCKEGRSAETWVDFDFFGNQISAHTTGPVVPTLDTGVVEDRKVPMPHFGAVLDWEIFEAVSKRVQAAGIRFIVEPTVRYSSKPGEQMTMFILDPSGNAIEFKAFKSPEEIFTR